MKKKRILALFLAAVSCLSLAVSASAASATTRKATDFKNYDAKAWYAEAVSSAVDNGLLYGKSSTIIDPNGDMIRAEMAAIINRSFGCYKAADISQYKDVAKSKWYYKDVALAVQMGTYNGRSNSSMAPDSPITRQEAMTVVARALELDYASYSKTDLSAFSDRSEISNWALPYVRAMVGADYIHGRGKVLAPLDNITRAEFAQIFHNIIGSYITVKGTCGKDIKGSVLIRTDEVTLKDMTVDGDLIIGCGASDDKIVLDNVTVKGRLLVWGGGTKAVYCNNGTNMPAVVVARVDDAVKVIYDRDSTLAVIDTIKVRITERAKQHKETEVIFYDVSGLREAQKQLNAIVADNQIALTAPAHLYALVGEQSVKAEFVNNSKADTYKIEIRRNKDNTLIADAFELAAGKSISTLTLLEAPEFGNADCTVTITAYRDGKQIGTLNTELTLQHTSGRRRCSDMVKTYQKAAALLLALALIFALPVPASAAETTEARVPVTLTVVNTVAPISCTVPACLPVSLVDGYVVTANNAAITNTAKTGSIKVTKVDVQAGTFEIGNYDDFSASKNSIALSINGCATKGAGALTIMDGAFPAIAAEKNLAIRYKAKVSANEAVTNANAATIVFTIAAVTDKEAA